MFALIYIPQSAIANNPEGIAFEKTLDWARILSKARADNKYIFIEFRPPSCEQCVTNDHALIMDARSTRYFNQRYIALSVVLAPKSADSAWHFGSDVGELAKVYSVDAVPAYLFLTSAGKVVNRLRSVANASSLIDAAAAAIRYDQLATDYLAGRKATDSTFMFLARIAQVVGNQALARATADDFTETLQEQRPEVALTKDNITFVSDFTGSSSDPGFAFLYFHKREIDRVMGDREILGPYSYTELFIDRIIDGEEVRPTLSRIPNGEEPMWGKLLDAVAKKYSDVYADKVVTMAKIEWYGKKRRWPEQARSISTYLNNYGESLPPFALSDLVADMTDHRCDKEDLEVAARWMKAALWSIPDDNPQKFINLSNYANLLYAIGQTQQAIAAKESAISKATTSGQFDDFVPKLRAALTKMRAGTSLADSN
jgi:hypothetical protein